MYNISFVLWMLGWPYLWLHVLKIADGDLKVFLVVLYAIVASYLFTNKNSITIYHKFVDEDEDEIEDCG